MAQSKALGNVFKLRSIYNVRDPLFGAKGDGVTDDAAAFSAAIAAAQNGVLYVPEGIYIIGSALAISSAVHIRGDGIFNTQIYRNFSPASDSQGLFNISPTADGASVNDLAVYGVSGTSGGCLISVLADASDNPGATSLRNLWLSTTGSDTQKYGIYIDGSLKTSGAVGVRDTAFSDIWVFGGVNGSVFLKSVVNFNWHGGSAFTSGGTNGEIVISGTAGVGSSDITISLSHAEGFDLDRLRYATITVGRNSGDIVNTSNVSEVTVVAGLLDGTNQANWTKSQTIEPGRITFPAAQNASTGANTLDDYEEGTWTPAMTFATPGDFSIAYTTQLGSYTKVGDVVHLCGMILTSTFTHSTASGNCHITGIPFNSESGGPDFIGAVLWRGITKANYTDVVIRLGANAQIATMAASGSAQSDATISTGDMPTGGTVRSQFQLTYKV